MDIDIDVYIFLHVSVWNEDLSAGNLFGSWFEKVGMRKFGKWDKMKRKPIYRYFTKGTD